MPTAPEQAPTLDSGGKPPHSTWFEAYANIRAMGSSRQAFAPGVRRGGPYEDVARSGNFGEYLLR